MNFTLRVNDLPLRRHRFFKLPRQFVPSCSEAANHDREAIKSWRSQITPRFARQITRAAGAPHISFTEDICRNPCLHPT
jgi:hypothetical protein